MLTKITARRLLTDTGQIEHPVVHVEDGRIVSIDSGAETDSNVTLTAGFFDVHVHGAVSQDFMTATTEGITAAGKFLATRGVAHYLPTTVTGPIETTLHALDTLASAIEGPQAECAATPMGIHLEGPFISHKKRGVQPESYIQEPSVELFDQYWQAARGHIRLMTIAPELPSALELITHAVARGVRVSLGHSNATVAETLAGIAAGATSATHMFNAMRALDHREPGIAGAVLDYQDLYAEAICDGVHVHPAMIRLWLKMKGEDRGILITDGISATGMPEGKYMLGDLQVEVKEGVCLFGGALAGSVLTMDRAIENLHDFTGIALGPAVRMASRNPARLLGLEHLTSMQPGNAANFNVYNDAGVRTGSILRGDAVA
jgi:N-acetylglucosamine-6-phosphate deacetylase